MKCQALFSLKNTRKKIKMLSTAAMIHNIGRNWYIACYNKNKIKKEHKKNIADYASSYKACHYHY